MSRRFAAATRLAGRTILQAAFALTVVFLLVLGIGPRTGAYRTVSVLTGSMRPTMEPGALLVLVPVDPASLEIDDVITFEAPTNERPVVTHRIIEIVVPGEQPVIRTQGDANNTPDKWTARISDDTAWRVATVVPHAGRLISFLRGPIPRIATLYVVPLLMLVVMMWNIWSRPAEREVYEVA